MRPNLNTLRGEIQEYLDSRNMVVFRSYPRSEPENQVRDAVYWDSEQHPDYRQFIEAAAAAGARLVTVHTREFTPDILDRALEHLSDSDLERDERRALEIRLNELRAYEGFTCQIELSFDHAQRTYIFDIRTDWFEELNDLVEHMEDFPDDEEDENPLGGYYSNN
jgi:hypothetical protein